MLTRYLRAFFAKRLGSGATDLEDLVQETLLAIHYQARDLRSQSTLLHGVGLCESRATS